MKKHTIRIIGLTALLIILIGIIYWQFFMPAPALGPEALAGDKQNRTSSTSQGPMVDVTVLRLTTLRETLSATGSLLPDEEVMLRMEVAGVIEALHFKEGQRVQQGALLVSLHNDDLLAQLKKVRYEIALAKENVFRQRVLLEKGAIAREEFDRTLTTLNTLRADSALLAVNIDKTYLRAPFSGTLGLRMVSEGSYISPATEIAPLVRTNPVKIEATIPEKYYHQVAPGDTLLFRVENAVGQFVGTIYAKSPEIDQSTRTFRLRALAANPDQKLTPGTFATVSIPLQAYANTIMVPAEAIVPELGVNKIYLLKNGKVAIREIQTGIRTNEAVQVTEGLAPGDTIIDGGILQVRPGGSVTIRKTIIQQPS